MTLAEWQTLLWLYAGYGAACTVGMIAAWVTATWYLETDTHASTEGGAEPPSIKVLAWFQVLVFAVTAWCLVIAGVLDVVLWWRS